MDTVKGILLIATIVLSIGAFLLFIQSSGLSSQIDDATRLNRATLDLLRVQGVPCDSTASDFTKTAACIDPLLIKTSFKRDSFEQPDSKKPSQGFIVIKNAGVRAYNASLFTFYFNREKLVEGCSIPGNIDKDVTCRFNFPNRCEKGDVLEITYLYTGADKSKTETKIFTNTC